MLQNETGEALQTINTDDEPVPHFVHYIAKAPGEAGLFPPTEFGVDHVAYGGKAAPPADLRVRMRLETPVIYFHLPSGKTAMNVDVEVDFQQGFLTQFFPNANATVNNQPLKKSNWYPKDEPRFCTLKWSDIQVGTAGPMPETTDHVWLAPRNVNAARITVGNESEQFLFYRGVGTLELPLRVVRHDDQRLEVRINPDTLNYPQDKSKPVGLTNGELADSLHKVSSRQLWWLVEVLPNGRVAFRRPNPQSVTQSDQLTTVSGVFTESEFSNQNLIRLRKEMHQALVGNGLNADEADGLLNTWELSYFLSPGQRLFFLVPQLWTDAILPLRFSVPVDLTRVMVGRIELVTPRQRELIHQMSKMDLCDHTELLEKVKQLQKDPTRRDTYNAIASGRGDSSVLGAPVPPIYQAFLDLGRFRTALLVDALKRDRQSDTPQLNRILQFQYELLYPGKLKWD